MASLLKSYEQQFGVITASITAKTAGFKEKATNPGEAKFLSNQIEKELEEAKDILEQMRLEVRELDSVSRSKYLTRIESFQVELSRLEKEYQKRSINQDGEEFLVEENGAENFLDPKQQLINSEKLERGVNRLGIGYQIAIETEQIGNHILTDLSQQKETMLKTRNRLRETDEEMSRSGRILNRMSSRILQNRLLVIGSVILIVTVIIIALFIRFRRT